MPEYIFKRNEVYFGDTIEVMSTFPDKCIDFIFADLPFSTTKCPWDSPIDLTKLWEQYERIIKDNGCIALFAQTPFDKVLGASNLSLLRYEWIWEKVKATGHYNAKKMPMKAHENILIYYRNLPTYNPQKTTGHKPVNSFTKKVNVANKTRVYGEGNKDIVGGGNTDRYPRDTLKFSSDTQKMKGTEFVHDTQKPILLAEYFVKTYTNEGDLVLDNVSGSGTTGLACKNLNRDFLMIENDEAFYNMSKRRVGM